MTLSRRFSKRCRVGYTESMNYQKVCRGWFLSRPNRFIARVLLEDGQEETVHVKNTGRCRELLLPGAEIWLAEADNPGRKTRFDLICVRKQDPDILVSLDSQGCNTVMKEWLIRSFPDWTMEPEAKYGSSRLDFHLQKEDRSLWVEVKGCSLERDGMGYFPDAPSPRAVRHLQELTMLKKQGNDCAAAFVLQAENLMHCLPNEETDPRFAAALLEAARQGVEIWFCQCRIAPDGFSVCHVDRQGAAWLLQQQQVKQKESLPQTDLPSRQ